MNYPQEFKDKCKKVYPDWGNLHRSLENGNPFAGRYLDDASDTSIGLNKLNEFLEQDDIEGLKKAIRTAQEKCELYCEWGKIYDKQN